MSEKERCPLCERKTDEPLVEVCEDCEDKAASFDITKIELDEFKRIEAAKKCAKSGKRKHLRDYLRLRKAI